MTPVDELLCGRYRIERLVGQGGMADVFLAADVDSGDKVAVKLVRSADPELARRFAQEAKALARLQHPGMVRLLDAGVHAEQAFLVMELVEGPTLSARLRRGPLSPLRTATLGRTLAAALAYVHAQGVVHRDVKPANVLLGPGPRVRLADFGIARLAGTSSLTATGTTLGTAGYMAPEQLEHHDVGPAADVWSLGVILVECLTGRRVYEGTATEIVARRLAGPVPLPPGLPVPWHLLFLGMLAHDPALRLSGAEVGALLAAEPFSEPWAPPPTAPLTAPVGPGLAPNASGGQGHDGPTLVAPAVAPAGLGHAPTPTADPQTSSGGGDPRAARRHLRPVLWAAAALVVAAAAGTTGWALSRGTPGPDAPRTSSGDSRQTTTATAPPPSTTTTSTTTTTTTTVPSASTAAGALVHDAEAGVSAGTISAAASGKLLNELDQTLSAQAAGDHNQVSSDIGTMDGTIAGDVKSGTVSAAEASTLVADVAQLAQALGASTGTTAPSAGGTGATGTTGNTGTAGGGGGAGNSGGGPGRH